MAAPQLNPAPNPAHAITSPFFTCPDLTASSNAKGIDAALVLPYLERFVMTLSIGMPNRFATVSMMRILACVIVDVKSREGHVSNILEQKMKR